MTLSKKHKKIICYYLENDKECVKNENNRRKKDCDYDAIRKNKSSTVDLRNRFIVVMIQKLGEVVNTVVVLNKIFRKFSNSNHEYVLVLNRKRNTL